MSLPTLTQNLTELIGMGLVDNSEVADSNGGRKPRILSVVPQARWALGVELSSHHIRLVALDLQIHELGFRTIDLPFHTGEEYSVRLSKIIERFIDELALDRKKLLVCLGTGLALLYLVYNPLTGVLSLPWLSGALVGGYLTAALPLQGLYCLCALLSLVPLAFYRGQHGIQSRWFFYVFYPAHLLGLWALRAALN